MSVQRGTKKEALEHFNAFLACLTDRSVFYLTKLPQEALEPEQLTALRLISEHFFESSPHTIEDAPSSSRDDQAQTVEHGEDHRANPDTPQETITGSKRPVGRPRTSEGSTAPSPQNGAWGPILMIREIKMHDQVGKLLEAMDISDMTSIFIAPLSLPNPTDQRIPNGNPFEVFCTQVSRMSKETVMDRVRWLFMVLAVGDMASTLIAVNFGRDSTTSVPKNAAVQQLLKADTPDSVKTMADMAINLKLICHTLGVGCLFYLESVLNESFLGCHLTRQGRQFNEMSKHLQTLGLGQSIEASGADKIGKAIESHLAFAYKIDGAVVGQSGISVDLSGE